MFKALIASRSRIATFALLCTLGFLTACNDSKDKDSTLITVAPESIQAGESALLYWDAGSTATSCTASGAWTGDQPTSSGEEGISTGVIAEAGLYTFTLTCQGGFGTVTGSAELTVTEPPEPLALDCGIGQAPTQALLAGDGASVAVNEGAATFCLDCSVDNPTNIINKNLSEALTTTYATINTPLAINGATSITVTGVPTDVSGSYPLGPVGFLISAGDNTLLSSDSQRQLVVQTLMGGSVVETFTQQQSTYFGLTTQPNVIDDSFSISFLGLTYSTVPSDRVLFVGFNATQPYDAIRLGSVVTFTAGSLSVYAACVAR